RRLRPGGSHRLPADRARRRPGGRRGAARGPTAAVARARLTGVEMTPRKVVAGYFLSLDGVAEAPDRFITNWDEETDASGATLIATQDAVILGRRSYDEWAGFWPGSEIEPFASFINAVTKYVATSTPLEREWTNSRVIDGGLVDFVRHLKGQP